MAHEISNGYWRLQLAGDRAVVESLAYDGSGRADWCGNLLKTAPAADLTGLAAGYGGQTGYFDGGKQLHLSCSSRTLQVRRHGPSSIVLENIAYGDVAEDWKLELDGRKLVWTVEQRWNRGAVVSDAFVPALFFAARKEYGGATEFQLWNKDMEQDDFYGHEAVVGGASTVSRRTRREPGGSGVVKLLSNACPQEDLQVTVTGHLKKGAILNKMSLLAQGLWCEPGEPGETAVPSFPPDDSRSVRTQLVLEPLSQETGLALDVVVSGELERDNRINRRFYDTHVNCGIMADTQGWRFGNSPSGYVALFCQYMYSEMIKFGVPQAGLGPNSYNSAQVLRGLIENMAAHMVAEGNVGDGYQADTSLDINPSFLLAMRNLLVLDGSVELGRRLFPAARMAVRQMLGKLEQGGGMIVTDRKFANDYWDWLMRDGRLTSVNVIAYAGLQAFCEIARWLDCAQDAAAAGSAAKKLADLFNRDFWDEELGYYTDWIDLQGEKNSFFYTGSQLQAIVSGMVPEDRALKILDAIDRCRRELGTDWANCFSIQTNFVDAQAHTTPYFDGYGAVTAFGQTMNGGCLVSWNYYWIGALVKAGRAEQATAVWRNIAERFASTSLVEGCNFWDYSGKPSRTTPGSHEVIAFEPFLSDQGLVSAAMPRWLCGLDPRLDKLDIRPALPPSAYPARAKIVYMGEETVVELRGPEDWTISSTARRSHQS